MLDMATTDQAELRSASSPWRRLAGDMRQGPLRQSRRCDVLIVGAGITGAMLAEHLSHLGHEVLVIDRDVPAQGSTAASTAMLQWEIDAPLAELTDLYGFEASAEIYRQSLGAVAGLSRVVERLALRCSFRERATLYLAAGDAGPAELRREHELRQRAGLPGEYLGREALGLGLGILRDAAILSPGSADADPVCLAQGLLMAARQRGVEILAAEAVTFDGVPGGVGVTLSDGLVIEARHVVLATGYVLPSFMQLARHRIVSSWAIATRPQRADSLWPGQPLVWEASESYAYMRSTADGRVVFGGEDEEVTDAVERDAAIPAKTALLRRRLETLLPRIDSTPETRWAGFFGETDDGLPLIGPVPGHPRIQAAYGYGGNGITFSFMASRMIARMLRGERESWFEAFALDR